MYTSSFAYIHQMFKQACLGHTFKFHTEICQDTVLLFNYEALIRICKDKCIIQMKCVYNYVQSLARWPPNNYFYKNLL